MHKEFFSYLDDFKINTDIPDFEDERLINRQFCSAFYSLSNAVYERSLLSYLDLKLVSNFKTSVKI